MRARPSMLGAKSSLVFVISVSLYLEVNIDPVLKFSDVLNRYPSYDNLEHTIHVMKHIFPRQFNLHNVFTSSVDGRETSQAFKDYTLREEEIALTVRRGRSKLGNNMTKSSASIPRRLRGSPLDLVAKLQRLHSRCSYVELLKHYCHIDVGQHTI